MASALTSIGVRHGDAVAIALPNGLPAIVSFLAASIVGTAAPLNPAYPYEEFLFFLGDTNARILLCPPVGAEFARSAAADCNIPVYSVEMNEQGNVTLHGVPRRSLGDRADGRRHRPGPAHQRKHRTAQARSAAALQSRRLVGQYRQHLRALRDDVSLCIMPLFHVHGLMASTMATLVSGGTVIVPTKFNALSFWRTVRDHRVTWYSGVPTMHQLLLARAHQKPIEAELVRFIRSCSAPLSPELIHKIEGLFGVPFVEAYGMTEAAHQMTSNPLPPRHRKAGSVGVGAGLRVSIMDKEGNDLGTASAGRSCHHGRQCFSRIRQQSRSQRPRFHQRMVSYRRRRLARSRTAICT